MDRRSFSRQYCALDGFLAEALSLIKPSDDDVRTRNIIIAELKAVVKSVESLQGATVQPFGSFVSQLYSRWGDLDISIDVASGSSFSSTRKKQKQNLLRDIMKALQQMRGVAHCVQFIPKARVPLLIFESNHKNISCDISINNMLGHIKSKLLLWISEIDERFRDMVLLVKEWAKSQNINDPKTGTLNSYSLSMLVIFHFQTCEPAILPPLQEFYVGNIADDLTGRRFITERNIEYSYTANIKNFKARNWRNVNKSSLAELFTSFFQKFLGFNTMALEHAVCPYTGKWEPITSKERWMTKTYPLLIEDPFEQPENAARAVSRVGFMLVSNAFEETYRKLSRNQDQRLAISSLIRPQFRHQFNVRTQGNESVHSGVIGYTHLSGMMKKPFESEHINHSRNSRSQKLQFSNKVQSTQSDRHTIQFGAPRLSSHSSERSSSSNNEASSSSSYDVRQFENEFKNMEIDDRPTGNIYSQRQGQATNNRGHGTRRWRRVVR